MILVGNQRGGASNLAGHLLKQENEHIEVHEIRGFASENLHGALNEAYAVSRGTKCKQFLFSLSLNPPPQENVNTEIFEAAIERIEEKLGLSGQPRAIVFHEKEGPSGTRRHAHAVWSRIDTDEMKAVQLSFTKKKLRDVSRDLYIEHGWKMPRGFVNSHERNPKNFTLAEWQQAKRVGKDPRTIKTDFQDAWAISDSKAAFTHAMQERGYKIARGDRRGFVAVDIHGEVYSIPKLANVKTKLVRQRLGDEKALPRVADAKDQIAQEMLPKLDDYQQSLEAQNQQRRSEFDRIRKTLVQRQRIERQTLREKQETRRATENKERQARFRVGIGGLWDRLRGEHKRIQEQNEREASASLSRDRGQKDALVFRHIEQRRHITRSRNQDRTKLAELRQELMRDRKTYSQMKAPPEQREERRRDFLEKRQNSRPTPRNRGPSPER
jgi:MobA/VirD2-like, nuclease domain